MTDGYLVFALAGKQFGVRLDGAVEIVPWRQSRSVPLSYSYVEGLLDYRGTIYPVFNVAAVLGLRAAGPIGFTADAPPEERPQSIILLRTKESPFGIAVGAVVKMTRFDEIQPPPKDCVVKSEFVNGLAYDQGQETVILDFERLLFHGR